MVCLTVVGFELIVGFVLHVLGHCVRRVFAGGCLLLFWWFSVVFRVFV